MSAKNLHIADALGHERLLLTACTPRGSAQFRLVVEALPESRGLSVALRGVHSNAGSG
jgi:sortase (surface protein transpeptidase)